MKRLTSQIHYIGVSYNRIEVTLDAGLLIGGAVYFIKPEDVDFFPKDEDGNSVKCRLREGVTIEFDGGVHPAVRELKNIRIVIDNVSKC